MTKEQAETAQSAAAREEECCSETKVFRRIWYVIKVVTEINGERRNRGVKHKK